MASGQALEIAVISNSSEILHNHTLWPTDATGFRTFTMMSYISFLCLEVILKCDFSIQCTFY